MILVDTSVWVDHLRYGDPTLERLLNTTQVLTHPFVIGEIACGNLKRRANVLALLQDLPHNSIANNEEVLFFIERQALMGKGIGYIDAHLLAAVTLDGNTLWTRDKRLQSIAVELGLAYPPTGTLV